MEVSPCFVDETGTLSVPIARQPVFCIGALVVPDPHVITERLYQRYFSFKAERSARRRALQREIRASGRQLTLDDLTALFETTRHHEYKFTEVKRHNVQDYINLINIYFEFSTPIFHALVLDRQELDLAQYQGDPWRAYEWCVTHLLERRLDRDVFVILDLQTQPKKATRYLEEVVCSVPRVKGCLRVTSDTSVLLQVCDLFLGCLSFDWRDSRGLVGDSSRVAAKRLLVDFLKQRLGMKSGDHFLRAGGATWRAWRRPSRFTVWSGERSLLH